MKTRLFFAGFCFALSATVWLDLLGLSSRIDPPLTDLARVFVAPLFLIVGLLVFAATVFEALGPDVFASRRKRIQDAWRPKPPHRR